MQALEPSDDQTTRLQKLRPDSSVSSLSSELRRSNLQTECWRSDPARPDLLSRLQTTYANMRLGGTNVSNDVVKNIAGGALAVTLVVALFTRFLNTDAKLKTHKNVYISS